MKMVTFPAKMEYTYLYVLEKFYNAIFDTTIVYQDLSQQTFS